MSRRRDQHESDHRGRTEPTLGDLGGLDEPPRSAAPPDDLPSVDAEPRGWRRASKLPRRSRRRGWLVPVLVLALIGVVGGAWIEQNRLRNLLPRTELNDVLSRAQQALAAGVIVSQVVPYPFTELGNAVVREYCRSAGEGLCQEWRIRDRLLAGKQCGTLPPACQR